MMFDSIPHWFSRRTLKGLKLSDRYVAPPMPFGLTADEGRGVGRQHSRCARRPRHRLSTRTRHLERWAAWPPLDRVGFMRRIRPSMTLLDFG